MRYVLLGLIAANCVYMAGSALWPAIPATKAAELSPLPVPSLRLLSEGARVDVIEPALQFADSAEPLERVCLISAPYGELALARQKSAEIEAGGGVVELIERAAPTSAADYLVFIAPPESRAAAREICETLAARALECHVIPTGTRTGALSVGVFSRRELALSQLERVSALGYATQMAPLGAAEVEYRLMMHAAAGVAVGTDVEWTSCPTIADTSGLL